ncbi:hypothetical protein Tco_0073317 [Tanacetum coccineum]
MSLRFNARKKDDFSLCSMEELTFLLGFQGTTEGGLDLISQDKYVADILKKFNFATVKIASTPIETNKALVKDEEAEAVPNSPFDLEAFSDSDYAGASLDKKSTTGGCQFLGKRLISWQCKKQTIVANSTTKAEYVAAANCYGQKSIIVPSSYQPKKTHKPRTAIRTTEISQSNGPFNLVPDETVYKEWEDRMERAATTASSLDVDQIRYALTVNPTIYTSCIEQFWATAKVKTVNGERQIQALVDKKKVIITKTSIRSDLHFKDADGTDCLLTATIFEELARMGYEKPSQKLTFYKALFSPQWKFYFIPSCNALVLRPLHGMNSIALWPL